MIGYVKVHKPELKVKEYELYRGLYCSLCKALGRQYGVFSRLLLSYDLTFMLVVLLAVKNKRPEFKAGRCPFNPSKRCNYCNNADEEFSFAAAVTVLMFYYKVKDEIADGGFFRKLLMYLILPYASLKRKKAMKKYKRLDSIICESVKKQAEAEKSKTNSTDKAAHNSADALGKIFSYGEEENINLYRFGYFTGRWVYLIDAADDLEEDIKKGSFNVFKNKYSLLSKDEITREIKNEISGTLNMSQAAAIDAFKQLEVPILFSIIENVIFDSMTNTTMNVLKGKSNDERSV